MKSNIDVIVGCQYGSEGKGLVSGKIAQTNYYDWIISVNSAQAGHTVIYEGKPIVTRQLPSGAVTNHQANILIGAGAIINLEVLKEEIKMLEQNNIPILNRLYIHGKALIVEDSDIEAEEGQLGLFEKCGSTCEGVGMANSRRSLRTAKTFMDCYFVLNEEMPGIIMISDNYLILGDILLEGSQGFGLSLFGEHYPKCTSRDTTTSAFLSYARLSPRNVRDVYGVYRTYPIRVAGNSGYLCAEITWEDLALSSGYDSLKEITTVTKRVRRVGLWDSGLAKLATRINGVNRPILTFLNYLSCRDENQVNKDLLTESSQVFMRATADEIGGKWWASSSSAEGGWIYY